ncbi:SNF2 family N-terminal domain-containing protein [Fusarium sp. MPI-SDFR-AT-0072]|nr:SNF2 family N-terminal domain-containing protein [Fusarium sp. MPI-SDFR-AT-0072]
MDLHDQNMERPCKRIRLQCPEPDVICDNFEDFLLSDSELFPQLTCDDGFWTSILEPTEENKDEERLDVVGKALVADDADTVRHVCLGTITLEATSSFFKKRQESDTTVNLQQCGGITKLSTVDTGAYAGIIMDSFPSELLHRPSAKLSALLTAPSSLRVIILSHIDEAAEIGTILSNNDRFLQHPSPREIEYFELEMEYFNPQFLVTPGSRMPQLEDLAIEYNDSTSNASLTLDEQKKGQLIGIFDTTADLSIRPTTEPSPRLQTRLKDYQLKALTVMSEKECVNVESPQCPSLWIARDASDGKDRGYRHRITGHRANVLPICAGGILADEMGLGKTLCVLSLICWSLDSLRDTEAQGNGSESSTTLVVIPKSMIPGWQAQIKNHIMPGQIRVAVYHGTGRQTLAKQFRDNDIVLTTYQTLRSEWTNKGPLFTEQWFRVVLDEAHRIGNRSTQVFQAACELQSSRRWCLRRTKSSISLALPPPTVREEKVDLHPYDRALYDFFESEAAKNATDSYNNCPANASATGREKKNVLSMIYNLRRICDHGEDLLSASDTETWRIQRGQGPDFQTMHFSARQQRGTNSSIDSYRNTSPSAKVQRLIQNIRLEQTNNLAESSFLPAKSVVFSYWTKMLDLVQKALLQVGFLCERIDGQYSIKQRGKALSRFANDPCCTVMLATIGSGGEGIDLTSANHAHLLEPHWNPMAEEQAIARVHRIGQQRHVTATKYITPDSIEEVSDIPVRPLVKPETINNDLIA